MERQFILNDFHTWYDWRLILTAKSVIPPEPKTNYVDIDGMDGTLDLSEALTGGITYSDRIITATFWTDEGTRADRERLISQIVAALHGKKIEIIEPDDIAHYFVGRVKIKSTTNIIPYAEIAIEATCEPWRYARDESTRLINPSGGTVDVVIYNHGVKTVSPIVTVSDAPIIIGNNTELAVGSYRLPDLRLHSGVNTVRVSGNGSVTFTYREADL